MQKSKRLLKEARSRHFGPLNPVWGGGGPHVYIKFVKRIVLALYMEMCHISTPELLFERAYSYFLHLFMCEKLALSFLRINESNFRICVVIRFLYSFS